MTITGVERSAALRRGAEAELRSWLERALVWVDEADGVAMAHFRRDLQISAKPDRSLVTQADTAIETRLRERIADAYPAHGIVGEEFGTDAGASDVRWYIDPIDGTHNFVRGVPLFGTLLAVERDGIRQVGIMSAPALRERWYGCRGGGAWAHGSWDDAPRRLAVSSIGAIGDAQLLYGSSGSIDRSERTPGFHRLLDDVWRARGFGDFWGYALVAEGAAEGMVEIGVNPWDLAAPEVVVEEAGGLLTDLDREPRIDHLEVLASNGVLHDELPRATPAPGGDRRVSDGLGRLGGKSLEVRVGLVAGATAIAWAVAVLGPFGAATIDPDASSSVLYFQRITTGVRLEAFVPTTPKPLLTLVDGLTWAVFHDWRWLVWETIAAFGLAVGAAAAFTGRLALRVTGRGRGSRPSGTGPAGVAAGPAVTAIVGAAAFMTGALLTSSDLLLEVSRANSLIWAIAFWSLAGLFVVAGKPRPVLAGTMLFLAGLVRFETLALDAVALVAFLVASPAGRAAVRGRPARPPGALAGVVIAFLAVPVAMLHDLLLSGDPLYWLGVPSRYTAIFNPNLQPIGPFAYVGTYLDQVGPMLPLVLLAAVGLLALARAHEFLALAGMLALGLGVTTLLFTLAVRGIYISNRYYEPITVALVGAAAVGVGWLAGAILGRLPAVGVPASLAAGAAVGVLLLWPALPWDRRATTELNDVRTASERLAEAMPNLDIVIHDLQPPPPALLVPSRDVARVAVELPASLKRIDNSYASLLDEGIAGFPEGAVVFHDGAADRPVSLYQPLEVAATAVADGVSLTRLPLDVQGTWLLRVGAGGS